jgi:aspartate-semialdehyde dehydrogenase
MKRMGLVKLDPEDQAGDGASTMVIGATGSIGSVSARLLAMAFNAGGTLPGARSGQAGSSCKKSILKDTPEADVTVPPPTTTSLLGEMDMIVTSAPPVRARRSWTS